MTVTREQFEQGMSYSDYKSQMTRNQERFLENEGSLEISKADLAFFRALPKPLNVLVLAEDWCGDVIANLPVLGRLAADSGKLNLSVFLRDQHLDIMDQYLKDGQFRSIPVFVFFDENFQEIGHWIERPAKMYALTQEVRAKFFASDPDLAGFSPTTPPSELPEEVRVRLSQTMAEFRAEKRSFSDAEVIREIRALLSQGVLQKQSSPVSVTSTSPSWQKSTRKPSHQPAKVTITYCAECGYEPQTLSLVSALMYEFRDQIASIELIPWDEGMFDVEVDGELVHSMVRDGGFPENELIFAAVRGHAGVAQPN